MYESTCVSIEAVASLQPVTALCLRDRHYYVNFICSHIYFWKKKDASGTKIKENAIEILTNLRYTTPQIIKNQDLKKKEKRKKNP